MKAILNICAIISGLVCFSLFHICQGSDDPKVFVDVKQRPLTQDRPITFEGGKSKSTKDALESIRKQADIYIQTSFDVDSQLKQPTSLSWSRKSLWTAMPELAAELKCGIEVRGRWIRLSYDVPPIAVYTSVGPCHVSMFQATDSGAMGIMLGLLQGDGRIGVIRKLTTKVSSGKEHVLTLTDAGGLSSERRWKIESTARADSIQSYKGEVTAWVYANLLEMTFSTDGARSAKKDQLDVRREDDEVDADGTIYHRFSLRFDDQVSDEEEKEVVKWLDELTKGGSLKDRDEAKWKELTKKWRSFHIVSVSGTDADNKPIVNVSQWGETSGSKGQLRIQLNDGKERPKEIRLVVGIGQLKDFSFELPARSVKK